MVATKADGVDRLNELEKALDETYDQIKAALQQKEILLDPKHAIALIRLGGEACTVSQLGKPPYRVRNLSYTVSVLEEKGFITKARGKDPRTQIVRATKEGQQVAVMIAQVLNKNPPRALSRAAA